MNPLITAYLDNADRFSAVVTTGGDWGGASPCTEWNASDVLHHVIDSQRDFLATRGADLGPRPEGEPAEVWERHLDAVRAVVADEAFATAEYDGHFGRTSIADTLANFYGFDLAVHRWDLARALGQDVAFDDTEMDRLEQSIAGFGDALYTNSVCAPALDVPPDAPRQTRVLGLLGRRA